jgi:hypothetical protein
MALVPDDVARERFACIEADAVTGLRCAPSGSRFLRQPDDFAIGGRAFCRGHDRATKPPNESGFGRDLNRRFVLAEDESGGR